MLEFKVIQELEPNIEILEIIKNYTFTTKNGKVKHLLKTNLQFIEPTEYLITYSITITLTILEYKVNEISNKNFFNKFSKIFIQNPKKFLSKNRGIKIFFENRRSKIYFYEPIYRGGNFMRCGVYVSASTDKQRDNGYSIDSQLRTIKEYCEKNNYDILDVYNDAGHSGKDLIRAKRQRLLKEINIDYRNTLINFANYPYIMFAMAKIMEMDLFEQNKVALYLFNSINCKKITN